MKDPGALLRLIGRRLDRITRSAERVDRLEAVDHPLAAPLARALRGTLRPALTPEEREWIDRIEALRRRANRSTQPLPDRELVPEGRGPVVREITVGEACRAGSKSPEWCLLLFRLIRELRPAACLEMGTNMGISAAYQAAAMRLSGSGTLVSVEGQPDRADAARRHLTELGLGDVECVAGPFSAVLQGVLERHGPFDHVFVDGHHDGPATLGYLDQIAPHLRAPALLVFDDIEWSRGMRDAWTAIAGDPRLPLVVDLHKIGLTVFDPGHRTRSHHRIAVR